MTRPLGRKPTESSEREQWGGIEKSDDRCVTLSLPARPELWTLLRMAVSSVASSIGYDPEVIADLRLALDELCNLCAVGATPMSVMHLTCHWSDVGLYVQCSVFPVDSGPLLTEDEELPVGLNQQELSETILSVLVDAYGVSDVDHRSRQGWLRKSL